MALRSPPRVPVNSPDASETFFATRTALAIATGVLAIVLAGNACAQPQQLDGDWQTRGSADRPYDGAAPCALQEDDGVRGIQGLRELASRFGVKPYAMLASTVAQGSWQTERVIFHDVDTGATIVRLTNDPWADELSYFKGNWSADGQYIVFRRRPGMWEGSTATHGPMAVRSDGSGLRSVFRDYRMVRSHVCSPAEPNVCYAMADGDKLVAFALDTGKADRTVCQTRGCWQLKISPDGKYLMGRSDLQSGGRGLWIVSADGFERHEVPFNEPVHDSYQFHPAERKIIFWREGLFRTEGFVQCDFDGEKMTKIPVQFDWNHGDMSPLRGVHAEGAITRIRGDAWLPYEPIFTRPGLSTSDVPSDFNGYAAWQPRNQPWACVTRIPSAPFVSEVQFCSTEPLAGDVVNRCRVCYTGLKRGASLDNPDMSPDGTKVLFNSNMFGRLDVYCAVLGLPEPPGQLRLERAPSGPRISWTPPAVHAEIVKYRVFRSSQSGVGYKPIATPNAHHNEYIDRSPPADAAAFYAVSSIEHSGLESRLSEEVSSAAAADLKRRMFVEAEKGRCDPKLWIAIQGLASGGRYVWMRGREGAGRLILDLNMPKMDAPCSLWARVRGENGAKWTAANQKQSVTLSAPPSTAWQWLKFDGAIDLPPGQCNLSLTSSLYGSAIDQLAVSDDPDFDPRHARQIDWPQPAVVSGLAASAASPSSAQLHWQSDKREFLHHYNLYCGETPDFAPQQANLVASPDSNVYCDWGLKPGRTVYYRVTTVDCGGNESRPSEAIKAALPDIKAVVLEKSPAKTVDFDVPVDGNYVLWLRIANGSSGGQYINLSVDGSPAVAWTCDFDGLSSESWFNYDQWARWDLAAGHHALNIDNATDNVLKAVLLTNDPSYRPEGHVNILSGW
jgi:hypothetical protein